MRKILVLGGSGFLGRAVMRQLRQAPEFTPIAAGRRRPAELSGAWRHCDMLDADSLAGAVEGMDGVVNCMAGDDMPRAAANLGRTAREAGLPRLVHLSSMAVYDSPCGAVTEDAPLLPPGPTYAGAKAASEVELAVARSGATILRPGCVYGPGSWQWTERIARWLRTGRLGDLGAAGAQPCNMLYVDDLGRAVLAALRRPDAAGACFNLSSSGRASWNEYLARFAEALGVGIPSRISAARLAAEAFLAAPALRLAQLAAGRIAPSLLRRLPQPIPHHLLRQMKRPMWLDHRKADAGLAFEGTELNEGLRRAAAWVGRDHPSPRSFEADRPLIGAPSRQRT